MRRRLFPILTALAAAARLWAQDSATESPPLRTLTTAHEIRELSPEEARRGYPVKLRAVVTFAEPKRTIFLHDGQAPAFMTYKQPLQAGQLVEVEGVTYPGLYVPGITAKSIRVFGTAPLPEPRPISFEQLASGKFNYEWVEVRGIVRGFRFDAEGRAVLPLAMGDGRLEVFATEANAETGEPLVDAVVRVQGLAAGFINAQRQLVTPHLRITDLTSVKVETPAPPEPFETAITAAADLLRYSSTGAAGHRVKVRGVATHSAGGRALFLRDADRGVFVETAQEGNVEPGAIVEALGFPEMGEFSAQLRDGVFRVVDRVAAPEPIATDARQILDGAHESDLVHLEAELLDVLRGTDAIVLLLRAGDTAFHARIDPGLGAPLTALRTGSRLRVAGVARVTAAEIQPAGFRSKARTFDLLLRQPGDVSILHAPPWWNARRLGIAAGTLLLLVLGALAWVATLQRRVRQQTAIIGEKLRSEAALEERQRIAREFHDTLEQELVGLALRLDAAVPKVAEPKPRELLETARRLVQRIQEESRGFLWNLRGRSLDAASLRDAIANGAAQHDHCAIVVKVEGEPRRLDGVAEHELLRVAQEAIANAVKHGAAREIEITLGYSPGEVRLAIRDDGGGFDPARDGERPGHFGLTGMRERVRRLGGSFALRSVPGLGTTIEATIPENAAR